MNEKGKPTGLFLPGRRPKVGEQWVIVEGVKDAAALHGLGFNAAGLPTNTMNPRFIPLFAGVDVVPVPDADRPGRKGAAKTAKAIGSDDRTLKDVASSVRIATLPCEITEDHGQDVRDVLASLGDRGPDAIRKAIAEAVPAGGEVGRGAQALFVPLARTTTLHGK